MSRKRWQELDQVATPARWDLRITGHYFRIFVGGFPSDGAQLEADAAFIAAARTGWPAAERECDQLRAERDAALTLLQAVRHTLGEDELIGVMVRRREAARLIDESHLLDGEGQQRS